MSHARAPSLESPILSGLNTSDGDIVQVDPDSFIDSSTNASIRPNRSSNLPILDLTDSSVVRPDTPVNPPDDITLSRPATTPAISMSLKLGSYVWLLKFGILGLSFIATIPIAINAFCSPTGTKPENINMALLKNMTWIQWVQAIAFPIAASFINTVMNYYFLSTISKRAKNSLKKICLGMFQATILGTCCTLAVGSAFIQGVIGFESMLWMSAGVAATLGTISFLMTFSQRFVALDDFFNLLLKKLPLLFGLTPHAALQNASLLKRILFHLNTVMNTSLGMTSAGVVLPVFATKAYGGLEQLCRHLTILNEAETLVSNKLIKFLIGAPFAIGNLPFYFMASFTSIPLTIDVIKNIYYHAPRPVVSYACQAVAFFTVFLSTNGFRNVSKNALDQFFDESLTQLYHMIDLEFAMVILATFAALNVNWTPILKTFFDKYLEKEADHQQPAPRPATTPTISSNNNEENPSPGWLAAGGKWVGAYCSSFFGQRRYVAERARLRETQRRESYGTTTPSLAT